MATLQKGLAVNWGVDGVTCTGAVIAAPSSVQSAELNWSAKKTELLDANGEAVGLAYSDPTKAFTISVIPAHDTLIGNPGALATQDAMVVAPGTVVTLTDTGSTKTTGIPYLLTESRLRRTNTGAAIVEMDLIAYSTDVTTTIT